MAVLRSVLAERETEARMAVADAAEARRSEAAALDLELSASKSLRLEVDLKGRLLEQVAVPAHGTIP